MALHERLSYNALLDERNTFMEQLDFWPNATRQYQQAIQDSLPPDYDPVTKPKHYMLFEDLGIEVRDVIAKLCDKIEKSEMIFSGLDYSDYAQMMQYLMRFMDKGGVQDLNKALFYLTKLIESCGDES